ncbi:hypothetical protein G6F68_016100 [Rhizopus microsporus]|nr:hypothetical protein G6F68_016100 [Rhizopus microsporus]
MGNASVVKPAEDACLSIVRVAELGSIGRAARDLGVVASALSPQISRLESELATRLLMRTHTGVVPTAAGTAFLRQARLTLRHAENAIAAAREARRSGMVSVGFAPTTASVWAKPPVGQPGRTTQ